jgi:hypothetical protein
MASTNGKGLDRSATAGAKNGRERLKRTLLLGFVGLSIILIGLIWAEGLSTDTPATPSYYRDTFQMDPDVYLTITAEAAGPQDELTGTPVPGRETDAQHGNGQGQGHGQGQGQGSP